jgi:aspartate aminotransferase
MISRIIAGQMSQGSFIRKMFEEGSRLKAVHGADKVFDFSIGNPDLEPPEEVIGAIRQLASDSMPGLHSYMTNAGHASTRAAVAARISRRCGFAVPEQAVCMTGGAAGALNVALKSVLDPGDEVIVLAPYFVEYLTYITNHGGVPVVVPCDPTDLQPDLAAVRRALTPRTKALIINSPNNPSGEIYPSEKLCRLNRLLLDAPRTIYVLSDEPYSELVYDGLSAPATFACLDHAIICDSWSKSLSLPGERIGYLAVNPHCEDFGRLTDAAAYCNRILGFVNAPAFFQKVVEQAIDARVDVSRYETRRNMMADILQAAGFTVKRPSGGFYLFPRTPIADDVAFVTACASHLVLVVPGSGFGYPGHFRLCFAASENTIRNSAQAFRQIGHEFGLN